MKLEGRENLGVGRNVKQRKVRFVEIPTAS